MKPIRITEKELKTLIKSVLLKEDDSDKLRYNILDFDDNILSLPSKIKMQYKGKPVKLSTKEFAEVRDNPDYKLIGNPPEFRESFEDFSDDKIFLKHVKQAIRKDKQAPSFDAFKQTLIGGHLFAIVTARGNSSDAIRKAVEYFIYTVLSDEEFKTMISNLKIFTKMFDKDVHESELLNKYLDSNSYIGVSSPEFLKDFKGSSPYSPEEGKKYAVTQFVEKMMKHVDTLQEKGIEKEVSFKFSDDDPGNISAIKSLMQQELSKKYPDTKFSVYATNNPDYEGGTKIVIQK